ncbi:galactitol-1-phosphate 5-dehydrogenase [soil metagenome]
MRAMVYTEPGRLELRDVDEPEPDPAEAGVVVDVGAVGICGSDLEGFATRDPFRVPPLVMGHELAGVRADSGRPVVVNPLVSCLGCDLCLRGRHNLCRSRALVGIQRDGGFAERVVVPERNCHPLPDGVSPRHAALVEPLANASHEFALAQAVDPAPERVGVIGAGMLGLAVTLVAVRRGTPAVTVADPQPARRETARGAGAHHTGERLDGEFDVIFDAVGTPETRAQSVERLRPGGTAVWIGLHGQESGVDGRGLIRNEQRVLGTFCYLDRDFRAGLRMVAEVCAGLEPDALPPWVAAHPLEDGVEVFHSLLDAPPAAAKTLLIP